MSGNFCRNDDISYKLEITNGNVFVVSDFFIGSTTHQYYWIGLYSNEYESNVVKYSYSGVNLGTLTLSNSLYSSLSYIREKIEDILIDN